MFMQVFIILLGSKVLVTNLYLLGELLKHLG